MQIKEEILKIQLTSRMIVRSKRPTQTSATVPIVPNCSFIWYKAQRHTQRTAHNNASKRTPMNLKFGQRNQRGAAILRIVA